MLRPPARSRGRSSAGVPFRPSTTPAVNTRCADGCPRAVLTPKLPVCATGGPEVRLVPARIRGVIDPMTPLDAPLVRAVTSYLPWLAPFADVVPFSSDWHDLDQTFPPMRIRLGAEVQLGLSGLLCRVPIGPDYPFESVPAGTILRFAQVSHGMEYACAWSGPPAPVFAVEGGPADGYLLAFYLKWLTHADVDVAKAIQAFEAQGQGQQ